MQYIYICFNFMIFNNTRNFNKYLLWTHGLSCQLDIPVCM